MKRMLVTLAAVAAIFAVMPNAAAAPHHRPKLRPAILFVHGGGWARGTANSDEIAFAGSLAYRTGWIVKIASYDVTTKPHRKVEPADIAASLRALREQRGVDPNRVFMWGESAGANLAELIAYRHPRLTAGVVGVSSITDMAACYPTLPIIADYEGQTPTDAGNDRHWRYATTSPINAVGLHSPPTFLANAAKDPQVPASQSRELRDRLRDFGIRHKMEIVPNVGWHATLLESFVESNGIAFLRSIPRK